jgi:heme-degrading monooxygenase HmoA
MFAQVYSYQFDPSQTEANVQFVKHVVLPDLQGTRGFKGGRMLVDRQTGHALVISYWENEADARAAAEGSANPPQPPAGVQPPAISNISVETYEVLIDFPPA